jgi:hypothetical protein
VNIIKYAEIKLKVNLSNYQKELLLNLQVNPEGWLYLLKLDRLEMYQVLDVYTKWQQETLVAV